MILFAKRKNTFKLHFVVNLTYKSKCFNVLMYIINKYNAIGKQIAVKSIVRIFIFLSLKFQPYGLLEQR